MTNRIGNATRTLVTFHWALLYSLLDRSTRFGFWGGTSARASASLAAGCGAEGTCGGATGSAALLLTKPGSIVWRATSAGDPADDVPALLNLEVWPATRAGFSLLNHLFAAAFFSTRALDEAEALHAEHVGLRPSENMAHWPRGLPNDLKQDMICGVGA